MKSSRKKSAKKAKKMKDIRWSFKEPKRQYSLKWYLSIIGAFAALILLAIFVLKSWTTGLLFLVVLLTVLIYTKRPRDNFEFLINRDGIFVGETLYKFERYEYFVIRKQKKHYNILLMPKKQLETELVISFKEELGEEIVDFLAEYMPLREVKETLVEKLIKKVNL